MQIPSFAYTCTHPLLSWNRNQVTRHKIAGLISKPVPLSRFSNDNIIMVPAVSFLFTIDVASVKRMLRNLHTLHIRRLHDSPALLRDSHGKLSPFSEMS